MSLGTMMDSLSRSMDHISVLPDAPLNDLFYQTQALIVIDKRIEALKNQIIPGTEDDHHYELIRQRCTDVKEKLLEQIELAKTTASKFERSFVDSMLSTLTARARNQQDQKNTNEARTNIGPSTHSERPIDKETDDFILAAMEQNTLPIYLAARAGKDACVKLLMNRGYNIDAANANGHTPLHMAAEMGEQACIRLLIQNKAKINASTYDGTAPIHLAALHGQTACLNELIESKCSIDPKGPNGNTPLHLAAERGNIDAIQLLISRGANRGLKNKRGQTPFGVARSDVTAKVPSLKSTAPITEIRIDRQPSTQSKTKQTVVRDEIQAPRDIAPSKAVHQEHIEEEANNLLQRTIGTEYDHKWSKVEDAWRKKQNVVDSLLARQEVLSEYGLLRGVESEPLPEKPRSIEELERLLMRMEEDLATASSNLERLQKAERETVAQHKNELEAICKEWGVEPLVISSLEELKVAEENATSLILEKATAQFTPGITSATLKLDAEIQALLHQPKPSINELQTLHLLITTHDRMLMDEVEAMAEELEELYQYAVGHDVRMTSFETIQGRNSLKKENVSSGEKLSRLTKRRDDIKADISNRLKEQKHTMQEILNNRAEEPSRELLAKLNDVTSLDDLQKIALEVQTDLDVAHFIEEARKSSCSPIYLAAKAKKNDCVELLIKKGYSIDEGDVDGLTSLHIAALAGDIDCMRLLIQHKAAINPLSKRGETPLHLATMAGEIDCMKLLIEHKAKINEADYSNVTPLHKAAGLSNNKRRAAIELLILHKADINVRNNSNETPLHRAAKSGYTDGIELLIGDDINVKNKDGETPLHMAAERGNIEFVKALLSKGAKQDARNDRNTTPLHKAAQGGHVGCINLLAESGTEVKDASGQTPLYIAALFDKIEGVKALIKAGANKDATNIVGRSPLLCAVVLGRINVIKYLCENGANTSIKDIYGTTAFELASDRVLEACGELLKGTTEKKKRTDVV